MTGIKSKVIKKSDNKGFTLVEMIVVLVILAILASFLIPALLGYIDDAKGKQDLLKAKSCLNAIQAGLSKLYAKESDTLLIGGRTEKHLIIPSKKKKGAVNGDGDVNATSSTVGGENDFANYVLELIDLKDLDHKGESDSDDPVVVIFGVGSNVEGSTATLHEKYTVYYLMYLQTVDSKPIYYFNGNWSDENPLEDSSKIKRRDVKEGPLKGKKIQLYIISNKLIEKTKIGNLYAGESPFWNYIYENY